MDIQCPNPECRADNPAGAKFCRKCGTAFTPTNRFKQMFSSAIAKIFVRNHTTGASKFTLDTFCNITFQPVSVVKIRFVNSFVLFLCILFIGFAAFLSMPLGKELLYVLDDELILSNGDMMKYMPIVILSLCILSALCALFILKWWIKKLRYKLNADYIEESFVNNEIVRIARKSRMGLFDKSKNKVLLSSTYSNIEKFDNQHLLISKGNKKVCIVLLIVGLSFQYNMIPFPSLQTL